MTARFAAAKWRTFSQEMECRAQRDILRRAAADLDFIHTKPQAGAREITSRRDGLLRQTLQLVFRSFRRSAMHGRIKRCPHLTAPRRPAGSGTAVPHSGQRSGVARRSYPQVGQRPSWRCRSLRRKTASRAEGKTAAAANTSQYGSHSRRPSNRSVMTLPLLLSKLLLVLVQAVICGQRRFRSGPHAHLTRSVLP